MTTYHDPQEGRLVCVRESATPEFWDRHWQQDDRERRIRTANPFVVHWTRRFLPAGSSLLEGGCGQGQNVHSLQEAGYQVQGADFAADTVAFVNQHAPELRVTLADVRALPFGDGCFDGYWSLGVIEHFFTGYGSIVAEAARVIRPGGYFFVTFPQVSFLRYCKAKLGFYPRLPPAAESVADGFYQFMLDPGAVSRVLVRAGFMPVHRAKYDGLKGFKDEISLLRPALQRLYAGNVPWPGRALKAALERVLQPWCAHCALLVVRKA